VELIDLKSYIKTRLESLVDIDVYDGNPYGVSPFPYLVFNFPSSTPKTGNRMDRILEIDYWDNSLDETSILEVARTVKIGKYVNGVLTIAGFDYGWQDETEGFYHSYIDFEGEIPDTEQNIYRINQRYILKVR
jgi:hypothetical protein